jgi:hypothetical protein
VIVKVGEDCVRGVEERFETDDVRGPDHGLDVKCWPAVCCHANELGFLC